VVHVPDIQREFLFPRQRVSSVNLRPARYPWPDFVPTGLFRRVTLEVLHQEGTWADQAHVSTQDVPQLGQLVETGAAEESAESDQAVGVREQVAIAIARVLHRPKLEERKGLPSKPRPLLTKEDRPAQ
jgi:hypothetical protein